MRIGVDYRFLSAGVLAVNRGMGRFTQQQLRETLAVDQDNEYVLFCLPGSDRSLILPSILKAGNVSLAEIEVSESRRSGPLPIKTEKDAILRHAEEYQDWIYKQRIDLYHATTPYVWHDIPLLDFNVCPYVSTYYDAIPLAYSPFYLEPGSLLAELCVYANEVTRRSDRLIAISESARQDAINYLGYPADRIDIAYPIADPWFRPLESAERAATLKDLRARLNLGDGYVMTVPHLHYSKNFDNLMAGYARLPADVRARLPLLIVCHLSEPQVQQISDTAAQLGIGDAVRVSGFVSEDELVALYGQATVFLHASRYEGFGLPVLEAMHCGTPVVASSTSSLPEVVGDAAVLIDPNDPDSIAAGVLEVARSESLRDDLRARGLEQAKLFTGERLGRATLSAYARTRDGVEPSRGARVAFWAPLPPLATGAGDYSAELLDYLKNDYNVEVFVDDGYLPDAAIWQSTRVNHHTAFARRHAQAPFDVIVYQMGASEYHWYMYEPLKRWPGLVMLHDLTWSHVQHLMHHRHSDMKAFRALIGSLEGQAGVAAFDAIWSAPPEDRPARLEEFLNSFYLLRDVIVASRAIVVPTDGLGQELVERYGPIRPVHTILMGVTDPYYDAPRREQNILRLEMGLEPESFVVGVFGSVVPVKRLRQIYQAFAALLADAPEAKLLIVGDGPFGYLAELDGLAAELGIGAAIRRLGHIPVMDGAGRKAFHRALQICDVVVNLRWPSHKQMSGTLARAIAASKPVVITDLPEWRHLPDSFCVRLPVDEREIPALADTLRRMARNRGQTETMSAAARLYFETRATLPMMVDRYRALIDSLADVPGQPAETTRPARTHEMFNRPLTAIDFGRRDLHDALAAAGLAPADIGHALAPRLSRLSVLQALAGRAVSDTTGHPERRRILVVGAAAHPLTFALTRSNDVSALSDYLGSERRFAHMLAYPEALAPGPIPPGALHAHPGDVRDLNFADGYFDAVIALQPLHELAEADETTDVLTEIHRVLRPGGVAILAGEIALFTPPGRDAAAQQLGLLQPSAWPRLFSDVGFAVPAVTSPTTACGPCRPPYLDLAGTQVTNYDALTDTPTSITQGIVHATSVFLATRAPGPIEPASPRPQRLKTRIRRQALASAARLIGAAARTPLAPISNSNSPAPIERPTGDAMNPRLHTALNAFNRQRLRGWYNTTLARLPRQVAALVRGFVRLAYLGHTQSAQFELYNEFAQSIDALEHRSTQSADRTDRVTADVKAIQLDQARIAQRVDELTSHGPATERIESLSRTTTAQAATLQQQQTRLDDQTKLLNEQAARIKALEAMIGSTTTQVREALAAREEEIRLLRSRLRGLEQGRLAVDPQPSDDLTLSAEDLRHILANLELALPELGEKSAVEVSVQAAREDLIVASAEYFGDRLSAAAPVYRAPNDAWIHLDFSDRAGRRALFESARNRLAHDGYFVVVSRGTVAPEIESDKLARADAVTLALPGSEESVTANIWIRR